MKNVTLSKSHVVCHPLYKYSILYSCLRIIKTNTCPLSLLTNPIQTNMSYYACKHNNKNPNPHHTEDVTHGPRRRPPAAYTCSVRRRASALAWPCRRCAAPCRGSACARAAAKRTPRSRRSWAAPTAAAMRRRRMAARLRCAGI